MSDDKNIPEATDIQQELAALQTQVEDNLNGWKRAQADYQNLKKDTEREKVELAKFANLTLLMEFLPLADNFDRAMQHLPEEIASTDWVKGVQAIHQQLNSIFASVGLTPVDTSGMFDPEMHESVGEEHEDGVLAGTILETLQTGYLLHGKLLRPAKVKIAS